MNHVDPPSVSLSLAVMALLNNSSGTIEEMTREALAGIAAFLHHQASAKSDCGGLDSPDGFGAGATKAYQEHIKMEEFFSSKEKARRLQDKNDKP